MKWQVGPIRWALVLLVSAAVFIPGASFAGAPDRTVHVLFIGNSYTYYNSLPQLVEAIGEAAFPGYEVETKFVGAGGATLKAHWEEGYALEEIRTGRWDYVVLQGQSMLGSAVVENGQRYFSGPDQFFQHAKLFDRAITKSGAETLFFMTWSRKGHNEQQRYLTYAYMTIARELQSKIAPVGLAWEIVRDHPVINLYDDDGSHPSIYGSYLAAATIVTVLFDTTPAKFPGVLEGYEILPGGTLAPQRSRLSDLSDAEVKILQDATAVVFDQLKKGDGYLVVEEAIREREPSPAWTGLLKRLGTAEGQSAALLAGILILFVVKGCSCWRKSAHSR